jgi:hypothetical protein
MKRQAKILPFVQMVPGRERSPLMPVMPVTLTSGKESMVVGALLDTGAALNAMPYSVGRRLGASWSSQHVKIDLTGTLVEAEARALFVQARIGEFPPVDLAFAWVKSENLPVILGQINFFAHFDVCFFRSRRQFEVKRARLTRKKA